MIERYLTPEMKLIWSDENRFSAWLAVELAVIEGWEELGAVPRGTADAIRTKARIDVARINELELETNHDLIAFVNSIIEQVGDEGRWFHFGLTSSDVVDTALALLFRDALAAIETLLDELIEIVKQKALEEADTLMAGRTHGVHAEPTTFGHKLAVWAFELDRSRDRIARARKRVAVGKISGAVGTYSNIPPELERIALEKLGLGRAEVSTQIVQRDRHAEAISALAILASSLDKFATEIRHLQKTEVLELQEPFGKGQKGSSAMPHKKNPIICERISGLARLVRGHSVTALENIALWHERDISHSSAERVIIPDATAAVHYMLTKFIGVMRGLVIDRARMRENLEATRGLVFSSRVLLALVDKGMARPDAYNVVQRCAMKTWNDRATTFRDELLKDPDASSLLTPEELDHLFDYGYFVRNVPEVLKRLEELA
jgi:adenylosuccinate lyase